MKSSRIISILTAMLTAISLILAALPVYAENPVVQTSFTPDPAPVVFDDVLYFYCGEDSLEDNGFYNMISWHCFSTTDMVNWTDHGVIMRPEDFEWAEEGSAWAAQCIERNGTFYLYVTVTTEGGRAIGVATSKSPTGPFKDALGKPLCGPNWLYIDPTVMIDDDGQAYLYFGNPNAYYCKLNEDMISLDGEIKQQNMTAEAFGTMGGENPSSYVEGPWIYKREGLYYLVYASHGVPEGISYSTSDSPLGPWKYGGVIMNPGSSTTIHPGIIEYKGHDYFFYHGVLLPNGGWNKRSTCIMEFEYNDDGTIPLITHSMRGVSPIDNFDPYRRVSAGTMAYSESAWSRSEKDGVYIDVSAGGYIKVASVDFKDGAKSLSAKLKSSDGDAKVYVLLDSQFGTNIGTIELKSGGSLKNYTCELKENSGVHDLYFVFQANPGSQVTFESWEFSTEEYTGGGGSSAILLIVLACVAVIAVAAVLIAVKMAKGKKSAA